MDITVSGESFYFELRVLKQMPILKQSRKSVLSEFLYHSHSDSEMA